MALDIYLDLNHWVQLGRAFYGKDRTAYRLLELVDSGQARLPLSGMHLVELAKRSDSGSRNRMLDVFHRYCGNWFLRPIEELAEEELVRWSSGEEALAREPIRRGLLAAFGSTSSLAVALSADEAEVADLTALAATDIGWPIAFKNPDWAEEAPVIHRLAKAYAESVDSVRSQWLELPRKEQQRVFALGVIDDLRLQLGTRPSGAACVLDRLEAEVSEGTYSAIPTVHVLTTLGTWKTRDRTRPTHRNDGWDLAFLASAIPYVDLVMTENLWAHLAEASGLSKRYGCRVLARTEDLHEVLEGILR